MSLFLESCVVPRIQHQSDTHLLSWKTLILWKINGTGCTTWYGKGGPEQIYKLMVYNCGGSILLLAVMVLQT
jgi:hypothetical protein